jgi:hypothetical protein
MVELRYIDGDLASFMRDMRIWFDRNQIEPRGVSPPLLRRFASDVAARKMRRHLQRHPEDG